MLDTNLKNNESYCLIDNNDRKNVIVESVEVNPSSNQAEIVFVFYQSSNKSKFFVNISMDRYSDFTKNMNRIIPFDYFMDIIFNEQ